MDDWDTLTSSIEDISVGQKQFPRRQQTLKPVLKYNTDIAKPVQLYNHVVTSLSLHKDGHTSSTSSLISNTSMTTPKHKLTGSNVISKSPCGTAINLTTLPNNTKNIIAIPKPAPSPYSRPLSAKDVPLPNNLQNQTNKISKSPSISMITNLPQGVLVREAPLAIQEDSKQLPNSFTRLTSAAHRESHQQRVQSAKKSAKNPHSNQNDTAFQILAKVRNLNYTPTKPYEEVNAVYDPSLDTAAILEYANTPVTVDYSILTINDHSDKKQHVQRLPEDREVSLQDNEEEDNLDEDDDGVDGLDDIVCVESEGYHITSTLSRQSSTRPASSPVNACLRRPFNSKTKLKSKSLSNINGDVYPRPALQSSLFPNIPPTINFVSENEREEPFPGKIRKLLKWRMSPITPDIVKSTLARVGFSISESESDGYSITSTLSRQLSTRPFSSAVNVFLRLPFKLKTKLKSNINGDGYPRPALRSSLFPNIPPTINFVSENERVEPLPWEIRKLLRWRMSPYTPDVIKSALASVGFRISEKNHDWLGCFEKNRTSKGYRAIKEYQKFNHFPGSVQLGRKDLLCRNLSRMQVHFGKKEFGFFPQTYVLPQDLKLLKRAWVDGGSKQQWIIKPPASARGIGINVIHKWTQIPREKPVVVQRYLSRPYLINDNKFDMRVYVYVSGYDPLRIYMYENGLARFASCKYSSSMKSLNNQYIHLTNYSINRHNRKYQSNTDDTVCRGHKWSLKSLWRFLKKRGVNTTAVWDSIKDVAIKTIISSESHINSMIKPNVKSRYCVHGIFGFDVMLDENLKPWILEVNTSPSLHANSQFDINIKGQMIKDMFNIAGFLIPEKSDVSHPGSKTKKSDFSSHEPSNDYCMDKRLFTSVFSPDEQAKHAYYCQRSQDEHIMQTILDIMTPDDLRILTACIDEDSRKGGFQLVFPTHSTHKYLRFFEQPRYYNLLLNQYLQRFNRMEQKGISLISSFCKEKEHLQNPTDNPSHQWNPPNATTLAYRNNRLTY